MMTGLGMGFGFVGLLLMVLFWGALIAVAVWLVQALFTRAPQSPGISIGEGQTARQILDGRYSRGEISREQYEQMKQDLSGK